MEKQSTSEPKEARVTWLQLEAWIREHVQTWIQQVLEEEVTEF